MSELSKTIAAFTKSGAPLPSAGDELWRYTSPELFDFSAYSRQITRQQFSLTTLDGSAIDLPGVSLVEWHKAGSNEAALLREVLAKYGDSLAADGVSNLQLSTFGGGGLIRIERSATQLPPMALRGAGARGLIVVVVGSGAQCTLVDDVISETDFTSSRIEIVVEPNAQLDFVSLQRLSPTATYLGRHGIHVMRDGVVRLAHLGLGGNVARLDLACRLYQPGAQLDALAVYVGRERGHTGFYTSQEHLAGNCSSRLYSRGVLLEEARTVFHGLIKVAPQAQKTDAYLNNRNLLLSTEARADSIPKLEIQANDVKCSHGSSVGQISAEEIFYLMSRGISRAQAERLIVAGFLNHALNTLLKFKHGEALHALAAQALSDRLYGAGSTELAELQAA